MYKTARLHSKMASEAVAGFGAIRVKFSENCSSYHVLYCKKHTVRDEDVARPPDKTLFVVNIPPYCTKVKNFKKKVRFILHVVCVFDSISSCFYLAA